MRSNPQRLGTFELQQLLGRGSVGEVWKAFDTQTGRIVAIKILRSNLLTDPNFIPHFEQERQMLSLLHHPNILPVRDFHASSEQGRAMAYIVMDYIEGQTLANYIRNTSGKKQFPSASDIVSLFASIGNALEYAHQKGIMCCNIKPANILIDVRGTAQNVLGTPLLTDIGLTSFFKEKEAVPAHFFIEKALYISPEQVQGYAGNEYSDIYSLGVILYEICTGMPPFRGNNPAEIYSQHVSASPTPPAFLNPNIPPALAVVILRCLAKDPASRFNNAPAMVTALAEAFDIFVPEQLTVPDDADRMNEPTYYKPVQNTPSSTGTPLTPVNPYQGSRSTLLAGATPLPLPASSFTGSGGQSANGITEEPTLLQALPVSPVMPSQSPYSDLPQTSIIPPQKSKKNRKGLIIVLIVMALLLVSGGIFSALYLLQKQSPVVASIPIAGHAYFISGETLQANIDIQSMDELLIDLHGIQSPVAGKNYYAWLLGDKSNSKTAPILLATLAVKNGNAHYLYQDMQHTNLLAVGSRFLVTEENANPVPTSPTSDTRAWRYYAELTQEPTNGSAAQGSFLDHLRSLLVGDAQLDALGLPGGIDAWELRNTGKILEWATSARDYWTSKAFQLMHSQFIRILDYLDSAAYVQVDVPANTPLLADPKVALLELDPQMQTPQGFQASIDTHLQDMLNAPGISSSERSIITQISTETGHVTGWLEQVRQYAHQLIHMSNAALSLPSTLDLLDNMATQALYAYIGRLAPDTNQVEGGAVQMSYDLQRLSTFEITPYKG